MLSVAKACGVHPGRVGADRFQYDQNTPDTCHPAIWRTRKSDCQWDSWSSDTCLEAETQFSALLLHVTQTRHPHPLRGPTQRCLREPRAIYAGKHAESVGLQEAQISAVNRCVHFPYRA